MKEREAQGSRAERQQGLLRSVQRSFAEFLLLPTLVIVGFIVLAVVSFILDKADIGGLGAFRETMTKLVFGSADATGSLLATLAASLITLTSITFSVLLLAVQQAAASMTSQVVDQFLRRRLNQLFFGSFLGLAIYCLIVLSTAHPGYNPVIGGTIALLLSFGVLYGLILLIYLTVNQIRPANIVEMIHDRTLRARLVQRREITSRTRRSARTEGGAPVSVTATESGLLTGVDLDVLAQAAGAARDGRGGGGEIGEVVLYPSMGTSISYGDVVAQVWPGSGRSADDVERTVRRALTVGSIRDLDRDPGYGVQQLVDIGWTTISTSKQNPAPGKQSIAALRDLLARWADEGADADSDAADDERVLPVVYHDTAPNEVLNALELMAVVSTESLQVPAFVDVVRAIAVLFDRLPPELQSRSEDVVLRILSGMADHLMTAPLESELFALSDVLRGAGRIETAAAVDRARVALAKSVGSLHSRADRGV
ncbi:DUF2254 family protein [Agromyces sp. NPDC058484]|uniref:DUF2254 family protein n=1 Tax=Agromyces sp. NPDC058484 TaxID=3346524 RepID=UPI0036470A9A